MRPRSALWFIGATLALSTLLACLSLTIALMTARLDLQTELAGQLPERLAEALRYSVDDREVLTYLNQQINDDLANIRIQGMIPLLQSCRSGLIRLSQQTPQDPPIESRLRIISVDWSRGDDVDQAEFTLDCKINAQLLIGINTALALVLISLWSQLPAPLGTNQQKIQAILLQQGYQPSVVRQILQDPAAQSLLQQIDNPWLILALRQMCSTQITLTEARAIVEAAPVIHFHHHAHRVVIHGVHIALPKTPYFYFAWYAMQRKHNTLDGWILNPAIDRPDRRQAVALISLMEKFGGHQKAINDLKEHGLRSKLLDQNRNKIKEELNAVLGEELAGSFLFETRRDARSSRYFYRLGCPPESILINTSTS